MDSLRLVLSHFAGEGGLTTLGSARGVRQGSGNGSLMRQVAKSTYCEMTPGANENGPG